jgi:hypothetical protein
MSMSHVSYILRLLIIQPTYLISLRSQWKWRMYKYHVWIGKGGKHVENGLVHPSWAHEVVPLLACYKPTLRLGNALGCCYSFKCVLGCVCSFTWGNIQQFHLHDIMYVLPDYYLHLNFALVASCAPCHLLSNFTAHCRRHASSHAARITTRVHTSAKKDYYTPFILKLLILLTF